jgi:tripartite-type tricarboxylate transporter receptor subunit TctC
MIIGNAQFDRRQVLVASGVAISALASLLAWSPAPAQTYPSQDLHFICGFPPGSGADVLVRYYAEQIRLLIGRTVIVENKVGASGQIAMESLVRSKPDGHTLHLTAGVAPAVSLALYKTYTIDPEKQLQIAATLSRQPYMIAVHSSKPYKTLAELTAVLKQKGDKGSYGVSNPGSLVVAEMYKTTMGLQTVQVEYRTGADAANDLSTGALDFFSADPIFGAAMARKGDWRILSISSGERVQAVGDLPTLKEQGVDVDINAWWAVFAPQATPKPVIEQINKWFVEIVSSEKTKTFMSQFGGDTLIETPEEGQARMLRDIKNWADYARVAKIKKLD